MSNLTVKGNASGTGTVILEAPNTNSNRTITLPDAATTLVGTADFASQIQAETGTDNTTLMTPLRVDQAVAAQAGVSKVWQSVTRNVDTDYQNTTGYPLDVLAKFYASSGVTGYIDMGPTTGSYVEYVGQSVTGLFFNTVSFTVPPGWYYRWRRQSTALTVSLWSERSA